MAPCGRADAAAAATGGAKDSDEKKTPGGLVGALESLLAETRGAFRQDRTWLRGRAMALASLLCLGRHTLSGLITTCGLQFRDWTAGYRLFSRERFDEQAIFAVVRRTVARALPSEAPLVVGMDDSLLRKWGAKAHGVAWRRDPLGPPFCTNFIRAQRVLQISAALPAGSEPCGARMVPIDFRHCPSAAKPRKGAGEEERLRYRRLQREMSISRAGAERLRALRSAMDGDAGDGPRRALWVVVDGRFTNREVLRALPERTVLIGRVRRDCRLYHPAAGGGGSGRGRRRLYGRRAPTPEELRRDQKEPWQRVRVWAAGRVHEFKVKSMAPLLWRPASGRRPLRLIVIAPLAYRPRKGSRLLYRRPAYLICNDPQLPIDKLMQAYIWRWGMEVNFRDEKTLLGLGQAQVRTRRSVELVPALIVAAYAMMLAAAHQVYGDGRQAPDLPPPKWRRRTAAQTSPSTMSLINQLRAELWGRAIGVEELKGLHSNPTPDKKPEKLLPDLASALLYASA